MNQNPEQRARDSIDVMLSEAGWLVQDQSQLNLSADRGVILREYHTDSGPADYVLFIDGSPVGIIEAKREDEGHRLIMAEEQSEDYAKSRLRHLNNAPLPFVWQSTGTITRFTDYCDPRPRSREVFQFFRPETLAAWLAEGASLRERFRLIPQIDSRKLRECQTKAIVRLEHSFGEWRPRALVQMATGAGKTFTAITAVYRLLKFARARRVLFLVDTRNLGEQAEQEFLNYQPEDDNRLFSSLYNVQRLSSSRIPAGADVCICTIQRLYSMLKGDELEETAEEANPAESEWRGREPVPVVYNSGMPPEFFDFIVIDECHRSIYKVWKQVLEYFDAFLIGLTATPDVRTYGFFNQNVVSEYSHEEAVADGVNVGYDVFVLDTKVTRSGAGIKAKELVDFREKLSRRRRMEELGEDLDYSGKDLDRDVVNPSQIRTIARAYRELAPTLFPGRGEIPKTLIFAKTDSHADDIIQIFREEFGEGNDFCKKVTYRSEEDPKSTLARFRNAYWPRIAVTVDMIATGTDVRSLECLIFMRDVRSANYFEQMKGRGTRTISLDDLRKVTPSAREVKDHFVIVDAVGVTKSRKTASRALNAKPGIPLASLLRAVAVGARDEALFTTLGARLARLDRVLTEKEHKEFSVTSGGRELSEVVRALFAAHDPDLIEDMARASEATLPAMQPSDGALAAERKRRTEEAAHVFTGELNKWIEEIRQVHEQLIDMVNPDAIETAEWAKESEERAGRLVSEFRSWVESQRDEALALQILFGQPERRRELTYAAIEDLHDQLVREQPALAPYTVWTAWERLHGATGSPASALTALVALIRAVFGIDTILTSYDRTVDRNFKEWIFARHSGSGTKFTEAQMAWLRLIKDHVALSIRMEGEDFGYSPFYEQGGLGGFHGLFGEAATELVTEINAAFVA